MGCEKLPCISGYVHFFKTKCYGPQKSQTFDFFYRFLRFLTFFKNYPTNSEVLVSILRMGYWNLPYISGYAQFFYTKILTLGKVDLSIFLPLLKLLDFSRNLGIWGQQIEEFVENSPE